MYRKQPLICLVKVEKVELDYMFNRVTLYVLRNVTSSILF
jgi:hypothetical protein